MRALMSRCPSTLVLPCAAIIYVAALLFVPPQVAAWSTVYRWANSRTNISWHSTFQYNQVLDEFPATTRTIIANGAYQWDDGTGTGLASSCWRLKSSEPSGPARCRATGLLFLEFPPTVPVPFQLRRH